MTTTDAFANAFNTPLVSVIVINHNYGEYLFECLKSIDKQTYTNIHCIVVDNASDDTTAEELVRVAECQLFTSHGRSIETVHHDTNYFQTHAAAKVISLARGPFVMFFDADDYMLPECVETHIKAMLSFTIPVGVSCSDYYMSSQKDLVTSTVNSSLSRYCVDRRRKDGYSPFRPAPLPTTGVARSSSLNPEDVRYVSPLERGWPWSGTAGLCLRRELVEMFLRRVPDLRSQLDSYLVRGINCLTGSILINRPLIVYRSHGKNLFAHGPTLANLNHYDARANIQAEADVTTELVKTLIYVADELAVRMQAASFLQAIRTVLASCKDPYPTAVDHLRLRHLVQLNREKLATAFGPSILEDKMINSGVYDTRAGPDLLPSPLLTFIVINFNYGRFLQQCIFSIMAQSYPHIECIIVDNASRDNSDAVLQLLESQHPYLRVVRNDTNLGQIGACREGFGFARGQFISFIDADDYLRTDYAEKHIAAHMTAPMSVGFTSSDMYEEVNDELVSKSYLSGLRQPSGGQKITVSLNGSTTPTQFETYLVDKSCVDWVWAPTSGNVYRAGLLKLFINCRYNADIKTGADAFFNYPINALSGSLIIKRPLAVYRIHADNQFVTGALTSGIRSYIPDSDPAYLLVFNALRHIKDDLPLFAKSTDTLALARLVRTLARKLRGMPGGWPEKAILTATSIALRGAIYLNSRQFSDPKYNFMFALRKSNSSK